MTIAELEAKWTRRLNEWRELDVSLSGEKIAAEVLGDLHAMRDGDDSVTLTEAHLIGGYSVDRLQKLVASGEIQNVGRRNRPRIRRADVPVKPGHSLPSDAATGQFSDRRRIVASVATRSTAS
jgi:hypothetical protein